MQSSTQPVSYRSTIRACYLGTITQAAVINLAPLLFIPLRDQFGLSYGQLGSLVFINFLTQVIADFAFSKAVDKHSFRPFIVAGHAICCVGLALFSVSPWLIPGSPYAGMVIATIVFSCAGGLLELLLSPILDAIPGDEKAAAMSLMHSFYAWGQVAVVLITTVFLYAVGTQYWPCVLIFWAILPAYNTWLFARVPLAPKPHESQVLKIRELWRNAIFLVAFLAILFGGAAEVTMNQWASAFLERGIGLSKITGDTLGMCAFAVMLGLGRLLYGKFGARIKISNALIVGSVCACVCYLVVAFSGVVWLTLVCCALCGLCTSLMWPGTLVVASSKLPLAGASLFALLAAGGDIGCSFGPWLVGQVTDLVGRNPQIFQFAGLSGEQLGLRVALCVAACFPVITLACHLVLAKKLK